MVSKRTQAKMNGPLMFDSIKFYRAVKLNAQRHGFTDLKAAILGTLALEECLREAGPMYKLTFLSTIGAVALPDVEKLEPADEEEATDKKDLLDFYRVEKNEKKFHPLLDQWRKINGDLSLTDE